ASLTLWKREKKGGAEGGDSSPILKLSQIIKLKGAKFVLIAFFAYCGMEATAYTWASTYLVRYRGIEPGIAAGYAALFFIGITAGRFLSGIVSEKIGDRNMIRTGIAIIIVGLLLVWLPIPIDWVCLYGLVIIGFGCGPIYPAIIHSTPINFGKENSQSMIGVQMASAYTGSTFMPPLFGLLANGISFGIFPIFLMFFVVLMLIMTERLNRVKN
ncbi:MAG: MFS transporter, partial [Lachnospiraceae bacterium]|nr:MFS transporter [Lachnospiraceae bacterium]